MSKSKTKVVSQDDFEAELKSETQVFDVIALTIAPRKGGGFNILKVLVDSSDLEAGEVIILDEAENRMEAIEKFKIHVIRQGVL